MPCIAVARVFAGILWCRVILFDYKIIALAKTVTPQWEPPAGGGGGLCRRLRNCPFSQGIVAAQKAMTYTDLLGTGPFSFSVTIYQFNIDFYYIRIRSPSVSVGWA